MNYLSTNICRDGVPFSHMIRDSEAPDCTIESQPGYNSEKLSINCMPLTSLTYKTDARKVHQIVHVFVKGETTGTWINPKEKK